MYRSVHEEDVAAAREDEAGPSMRPEEQNGGNAEQAQPDTQDAPAPASRGAKGRKRSSGASRKVAIVLII